MAEEFFEHLQLSSALGAKNMINPQNGKIIAIGGDEFNSLMKKYNTQDPAAAIRQKPENSSDETESLTDMMQKVYDGGFNMKNEKPEKPEKQTMTSKFKKADKPSKHSMKEAFLANPYVNPKTGRAIKKGSLAFNSLIKEFGLPTEF